MNIHERKNEQFKDKVTFSIILGLILIALYYFEYDFNNDLYNGLILLVLTILTYSLIRSNKYYIETGFRPAENREFELFNQMHPFIALYNKTLAIVFIVMVLISFGMLITYLIN